MVRVLSIDPSETGTTRIFFANGQEQEFQQFQSRDWKEHYSFIKDLVKEKKVQQVIYETTNFISNRTSDSLNLVRLLGTLECLAIKEVVS